MSVTDQGGQRPPENLPATIAGKAEAYAAGVLNTKNLDRLAKAMPSHVDPERFKRNLVMALVGHPKLLECNPADVYHEVGRAGSLGFNIDPVLGEAYLITGYDKARGGSIPQLRIGWKGFAKLARQSGQIRGTPYAHEVCAKDVFRVFLGTDKRIEHTLPEGEWDRGDVVGYYAVMTYVDGTSDFEVMSHPAIQKIRNRSEGYKAFKAGKISSTPWESDYDEMAKKTVMRRLTKRGPLSPEMADAMRIDDEDFGASLQLGDDAPPPRRLTPAEQFRARQLENGKAGGPAGEGFDREHVKRELAGDDQGEGGDVIDAEVEELDEELQVPCTACGAGVGEECREGCPGEEGAEQAAATQEHAEGNAGEPQGLDPSTATGSSGPTSEQAQTDTTEPSTATSDGASPSPSTDKAPAAAAEGPPGPKLTLAERSAAYETRIKGAGSTTKLKAIHAAAAQLRADLDDKDPERLVELDKLFNDRFSILEDAEKAGG